MTDADNASTSGQEPTASAATNVPSTDRAGYRLQAGDARNDERSGTDGGHRSPNGESDDLTPEQLRAALKAARSESAEFRRKAKELDDLKKTAEDAKLSESEKLQRERDEAFAARDAALAQIKERAIRSETRTAAQNLGLKPEAALRLIDQTAIQFDDNGDPTNIHELISAALQDLGLAPAASSTATSGARSATTSPSATPAPAPATPRVPAQSRGAVNPGAGASRGGPLTVEQIRAMSPQEYARNRAEIMRQLAAERGRLDNSHNNR